MSHPVVVTLLTDFGTADGYVGAMKGVIASRAPRARIMDITHDIAPQQVRAAAWALRQSSATFAPGSIHVAVVDPGVGSERRALLVKANDKLFVVPDNGIASWVEGAERARAWCLDAVELHRRPVSATFHGRDIFAAVAGHLAAGVPAERCGTEVARWERLPLPEPRRVGEAVEGEVIHVDRFGNLISNVTVEMLSPDRRWNVRLDDIEIGSVQRTYADVSAGELVAYLGSSQHLEVAVRDGSAAQHGGRVGSRVLVEPGARG